MNKNTKLKLATTLCLGLVTLTLAVWGPGAKHGQATLASKRKASSESNARRLPKIVKTQFQANGQAQTWDGRVFFSSRHYDDRRPPIWQVQVFRPENVSTDSDGAPVFDESTASEGLPYSIPMGIPDGPWSIPLAVGISRDNQHAENPFRSNANGEPDSAGKFETYDIWLVTQNYGSKDPDYAEKPGDPFAPSDPQDLNKASFMVMAHAQVVIRSPKTPAAEVQLVKKIREFTTLRTTGGELLRGFEPSMTLDGRMIVWQGHPDNDGKIDVIMYSWNANPNAVDGWSKPRVITEMFYKDKNTLVGDQLFSHLFPISQQPLRSPDGRIYSDGDLYIGAYPWISLDGTEIIHTSTYALKLGGVFARRAGVSIIGRATGYTLRYIDGPLNPKRYAKGSQFPDRENQNEAARLLYTSSGAFRSLWEPYRQGGTNTVFPTNPLDGQLLPIFGANTGDYQEVSFKETQDGDYVLYLGMNELITHEHSDFEKQFETNKTPDTSGSFNTGELKGGAAFPLEFDNGDRNIGFLGQAVFFPAGGIVEVPSSPTLDSPGAALTVEAFAKRLVQVGFSLVNKKGSYQLSVDRDGRVKASVWTNKGSIQTLWAGPEVPLDEWSRYALTFDGTRGSLKVFVDGILVGEGQGAVGAKILGGNASVLIGPGADTIQTAGSGAVAVLDEVAISRVVRNDNELRSSSGFDPSLRFGGLNLTALPIGLSIRDGKVPLDNQLTQEKVELGRLLFHEKRLSSNNQVSCATCHMAERARADGLARSIGVSGKLLKRNTPPIFNRAFSALQFWDGRATSLEDQASAPLINPDEMANTIERILAFLNNRSEYKSLFAKAFGDGSVTQINLERAIASYERVIVAGDSPADKYDAGTATALTPAQIRGRALFSGKARCFGCHSGPNYTDEDFHNTGVPQKTQITRKHRPRFDDREVTDCLFTGRGLFSRSKLDNGRFDVTKREGDKRAFKTPTLRQISLTAPYMHDGSIETLMDVVEFYNRGGGLALSSGVNRSSLDADLRPLNLNREEILDLVSFLESLSGVITEAQVSK